MIRAVLCNCYAWMQSSVGKIPLIRPEFIKRDTLILYLQNSSEEIELADILNWLSMYSNVEIKIEKKEKSDE